MEDIPYFNMVTQEEPRFYTRERWDNWVRSFRERFNEKQSLDDSDNDFFISMEEDVIIACLKVLRDMKKRKISRRRALETFEEIEDIVLSRVEPIGGDADLMFSSVQNTLLGVIRSCKKSLEKIDKSKSLQKLVSEALEKEKSGDIDGALALISLVGARVLEGEKLSEELIDSIPFGMVAEWLDGIEFMSMVEIY